MKPFIHKTDNSALLYSGNKEDAIPVFAFRRGDNNKLYAQVPGGGSVELAPEIAIEFGLAIIQLGKECFTSEADVLWGIIKNANSQPLR